MKKRNINPVPCDAHQYPLQNSMTRNDIFCRYIIRLEAIGLNDDKLALSYDNCVRNFIILDEVNKSFDRIISKAASQPEGEMNISTETADHYAQKFADLYDMFNVRLGGK